MNLHNGSRAYGNGDVEPETREAWLHCGVALHQFVEIRSSVWRPHISTISEMTNARGNRQRCDRR